MLVFSFICRRHGRRDRFFCISLLLSNTRARFRSTQSTHFSHTCNETIEKEPNREKKVCATVSRSFFIRWNASRSSSNRDSSSRSGRVSRKTAKSNRHEKKTSKKKSKKTRARTQARRNIKKLFHMDLNAHAHP